MRKRINLSISEAEYRQVEALTRAGQYKTSCAFVRGLLLQVLKYSARDAEQRAREPTPIEAEIRAMFAELMDWDTAEASQHRAAVYANEKPR